MDTPLPPLPRSLSPLPDESLSGYILRLAHRLDRSPGRIAELATLAVGRQGRATLLPAHLLLALRPQTAASFAAASRMTYEEVAALGLRSYARVYPPLAAAGMQDNGRVLHNAWAFTASSRFCPDCLIGDGSPVQRAHGGTWRLQWHLPVVFACTRHQRLLEHLCPRCRRPVNSPFGGKASLLLHLRSGGLHPRQCRNEALDAPPQRPRTLCGADLIGSPRSPFLAPHRQGMDPCLAVQERIQKRLNLTPREANDPAYFHDLIAVAQLITMSWPVSDQLFPTATPLRDILDAHIKETRRKAVEMSDGRASRDMLEPPAQPAASAALLLLAEQLLADRDPAHLQQVIPTLVEHAFAREPIRYSRMARCRPMTDPLKRAAARQYRGFQVGFRRGPAANDQPPSHSERFTASQVPQFIPLAWYHAHLEEFTDQLIFSARSNVRYVRRAASLKLAEMVSGVSVGECADLLNMPPGHARSSVRQLRRRCGDQDWRTFQAAVGLIARELEQAPSRPDYTSRRQALAHWVIPDADWEQLTHDLRRSFRKPSHRNIGSVIAWARATESDYLFSPLVRADGHGDRLPDGPALITGVVTYLSARKGGRSILCERLERYAEQLARRCDTLCMVPSLS